jgi:ribosomal protein S18 acetylase RimI-like enzyme
VSTSEPGAGAVPRRSIDVRVAGPADAAAFAAFAARTFRETYLPTCQPADVEAYVAEHFGEERQRAELADPARRTLFAVVDGALAGYAQLRSGPAPACVAGRRPMEVARFYVDSRWHGQGVAATLMAACVSAADADALWLGVYQSNARAVRFYTKSGFRVVGTDRFTMGSDVQDDFIMARAMG